MNDLQNQTIERADRLCREYITARYPEQRQANIARLGLKFGPDDLPAGNYSESDRSEMFAFIDAVRSRCHEYQAQIAASETQMPDIDYTDL